MAKQTPNREVSVDRARLAGLPVFPLAPEELLPVLAGPEPEEVLVPLERTEVPEGEEEDTALVGAGRPVYMTDEV